MRSTHAVRRPGTLALLVLLTACGGGGDGGGGAVPHSDSAADGAGGAPRPDSAADTTSTALRGCTADYRPGLRISAVDARTGEPVDRFSGYVRDGAHVDSLRGPGGAAGERPGTYSVEVRAPGYAPWDTAGVVVTSDECHVIGKSVRAELVPLGEGAMRDSAALE